MFPDAYGSIILTTTWTPFHPRVPLPYLWSVVSCRTFLVVSYELRVRLASYWPAPPSLTLSLLRIPLAPSSCSGRALFSAIHARSLEKKGQKSVTASCQPYSVHRTKISGAHHWPSLSCSRSVQWLDPSMSANSHFVPSQWQEIGGQLYHQFPLHYLIGPRITNETWSRFS
jgi:hypothetical protein